MALNQPTTATKYVMKVYDTETKADTGKDSDALYVVSSPDPTVSNANKINDVYVINKRYYYRTRYSF